MIRNLVTKRIRMEKRKYELNIIKRSRRNRKVLYKYMSSINGKKSFSRIGPLIDQGGITLVDDKDVAVLLNNFFVSVFTKKDSNSSNVVNKTAWNGLGEIISDIHITDTDVGLISSISE